MQSRSPAVSFAVVFAIVGVLFGLYRFFYFMSLEKDVGFAAERVASVLSLNFDRYRDLHKSVAYLMSSRDSVDSAHLDTVLEITIRENPSIYQIRLLDLTGRETLKYLREGNDAIRKLSANELQDKSDRPYFVLGLGLAANQIRLTHIELNEEYNKIEQPDRPVIRSISKVVFKDGIERLLVINVDFTKLMSELSAYESLNIRVLNDTGEWIIHEDPQRQFFIQKNQASEEYSKKLFQTRQSQIQQQYNSSLYSQEKIKINQEDAVHQISIFSLSDIETVNKHMLKMAIASAAIGLFLFFLVTRLNRKSDELDSLKAEKLELLERQRDFLSFYNNALPVGVLVFDEQRTCIYENERAMRYLHDSEHSALGLSIDEVSKLSDNLILPFSNEDHEINKYTKTLTSDNNHIKTIRIEYYTKSFTEHAYHLYILVDISNEAKKYREVTEKTSKLTNEKASLEKASDLKSQFLANMSHEIRTPINGILGMLQMLTLTDLDASQKTKLTIAVDSIKGLLRTLNDILDIAKLEKDKLQIEVAEFDLEELLQSVYNTYRAVAEQKGLEFSVNIPPRLSGLYHGDTHRLQQILNNLVGNALKFTQKGVVKINVREASDVPGHILFEIVDSGIGISAGQQQKLFQEFTQSNVSISREYGGTGLGLAISKKLASLMRGKLSFESEPGKGSVFSLRIHLTKGLGSELNEKHIHLDGKRVMIIGRFDDPLIENLREFLETWRSNYKILPNYADALMYLEGEIVVGAPFDVVIISGDSCDKSFADFIKLVKKDFKENTPKFLVLGSIKNLEVHDLLDEDVVVMPLPMLPKKIFSYIKSQLDANTTTTNNEKTLIDEIEDTKRFFDGKEVLVAEDNTVNQIVIRSLLEKVGCSVTIVDNGKEAVDYMQYKHYSMILMDFHMPLMTGLEATKEIRKFNNRVPILGVTAAAFDTDRQAAIESGMDGFVSKPVSAEQLYNAMMEARASAIEEQDFR